MIEFRSSNPSRPPDWRWQVAKQQADERHRFPRPDRYIGLATQFVLRHAAAETEQDFFELAEEFPDLFESLALYRDLGAQSARWEIEARILARQTFEEIGEITGYAATTIKTFEALFFSVAHQLDRPSLIVNRVFHGAMQRGIAERQYDLVLKVFAYWGGRSVLDFMLYRFSTTQGHANPASVMAFLQDSLRDQQLVKATIATHAMPVNSQNQSALVATYLRMVKQERQLGRGGTVDTEAFLMAAKDFFANVPWSNGMFTKSANAFIAQADASPASLRAAELLEIGAGRTPPGLELLLASARFPEQKAAAAPISVPEQEAETPAAPSSEQEK